MQRSEEQPRPAEAIRPENNFQRFVGENYEIFDNLNTVSLELKREDQGRRRDPVIDELAQEYLDIATANPRLSLMMSYGAFRQVIVQNMFDGRVPTEGQLHGAFDSFYKFLSPSQIDGLKDVKRRMGEVADEYREAVDGLREECGSARKNTHKAFVDYLSSSSDSLNHFENFLTDPSLQKERESLKQFLFFMAENIQKGKPENYFDVAINMWKEEAMNKANEEVLRRYLEAELKRSEESSSNGSAFFAGLKTGIEMGRGTQEAEESSTEDVILEYLKTHPWPDLISSGYKRVLDTKYSSEVNGARVALDQYRRVGEKFINGGDVFSQKDHKRRDRNRARKTEVAGVKKEEVETEKEYSVAILQQNETTGSADSRFTVIDASPDELASYLEKRANKIAPNDQRMLNDVKAMIESLRNNPYGFGTKKLTHRTLTIGRRRYPLRELMPAKRGNSLPLSHDRSHDTRVTYVIDGETVVIEDVAIHTTFDRKLRKNL